MIITQRHLMPIPSPLPWTCPAGCEPADMLRCCLHEERRLRADFTVAVASLSPDAEVLRADLAAAERRIDMLIDFGRWTS
jgi:hypothetical protein